MRKFIGFAAGALALAPALTAQAALTADLSQVATQVDRTIVTQGRPGGPSAPGNPDDPRYWATFNRFAGVNSIVSLRIVTPDGAFGCTGTVLPGGMQILTAAHCITNGSAAVTATSIDVRFQGPDNASGPSWDRIITVNNAAASPTPANMLVKPGYTGAVIDSRDLAILNLPTRAPDYATGVGIFNGSANTILGQQVTFAGFGSTGTGVTGDAQSGFAFRRRFGFNRFDATCATGGACITDGSRGILVADFDNGSPAGGYNGDTMCALFGNPAAPPALVSQVCNKGVTADILDEVGIGRGDSGGSALWNGMIVGVASWGARLDNVYAFGGFGTINGHASVLDAENRAWLQVVAPGSVVPEPSTYALMATGLAGLAAVARRRRAPKA